MKILLICFLFFAEILNAQPPTGYSEMQDTALFKSDLAEAIKSSNTIHAKFKQEKKVSILMNTIKSSGEMSFKKPQMLKWAFTAPFDYVIVLDGKQIAISDAGKVSSFDMSSSEVFRQINDLIINSLRGNVLDEKRFSIAYFENNTKYLVQLLPRENTMKEYVREIWVYFDSNDLMVSKIRMNESSEDYTVITFHERTLNIPLGDDIFKLH